MKPNEPLRNVKEIHVELMIVPRDSSQSLVRVSFITSEDDLLHATASSVGSGLQRVLYGMLERAVNSLDT